MTNLHAIRILEELILYPVESPLWTGKIFARQLGLPLQDVNAALVYLQTNGFIYRYRGEYRLTDAGRALYDEARQQPHIVEDLGAWKDEVLTGMRRNGQQTTIERAAIPRTHDDERTHDNPEASVIVSQESARAHRRIARELSIGLREYRRRMQDGSIRPCREYDREAHVGIHHRKGGYWHSLCRDCRQRKRREERQRKTRKAQ